MSHTGVKVADSGLQVFTGRSYKVPTTSISLNRSIDGVATYTSLVVTRSINPYMTPIVKATGRGYKVGGVYSLGVSKTKIRRNNIWLDIT